MDRPFGSVVSLPPSYRSVSGRHLSAHLRVRSCAAVLSDSLSHEAATADMQTLQDRAQWLLEAFTQLEAPSQHINDEDFIEVHIIEVAAGLRSVALYSAAVVPYSSLFSMVFRYHRARGLNCRYFLVRCA